MPPDRISFEDRGPFLLARYRGSFSAYALIDGMLQLAAYCSQHNVSNVLADLRDSIGDLTAEDRLVIANNMNHNFLPTIRLALHVRADQEDPDRTWETALSGYGFAAHSFTSEAAAVDWLVARRA